MGPVLAGLEGGDLAVYTAGRLPRLTTVPAREAGAHADYQRDGGKFQAVACLKRDARPGNQHGMTITTARLETDGTG